MPPQHVRNVTVSDLFKTIKKPVNSKRTCLSSTLSIISKALSNLYSPTSEITLYRFKNSIPYIISINILPFYIKVSYLLA